MRNVKLGMILFLLITIGGVFSGCQLVDGIVMKTVETYGDKVDERLQPIVDKGINRLDESFSPKLEAGFEKIPTIVSDTVAKATDGLANRLEAKLEADGIDTTAPVIDQIDKAANIAMETSETKGDFWKAMLSHIWKIISVALLAFAGALIKSRGNLAKGFDALSFAITKGKTNTGIVQSALKMYGIKKMADKRYNKNKQKREIAGLAMNGTPE